MKFIKLIVAVFLFFSFGCRPKKIKARNSSRSVTDTTSSPDIDSLSFSIQENKADSVYTAFRLMQIDTSKYSQLPIWDTLIDRYGKAYVDTFSVRESKFRLVSPFERNGTGGNSIFLERFINGQWINTKIEFNDNIHGGNLNRFKDINADGYIDITNSIRSREDVYFFNPATKTFIDTATECISPGWTLIDTAEKIFCDFQTIKGMCGQITSTLYTYHNFNRFTFYSLELYNCTETNDNTDTITKLILSKCVNGNCDSSTIINETILQTPIAIDYDNNWFDEKAYWKEKYKSLLGYR